LAGTELPSGSGRDRCVLEQRMRRVEAGEAEAVEQAVELLIGLRAADLERHLVGEIAQLVGGGRCASAAPSPGDFDPPPLLPVFAVPRGAAGRCAATRSGPPARGRWRPGSARPIDRS
jgi:hypothetical protein